MTRRHSGTDHDLPRHPVYPPLRLVRLTDRMPSPPPLPRPPFLQRYPRLARALSSPALWGSLLAFLVILCTRGAPFLLAAAFFLAVFSSATILVLLFFIARHSRRHPKQ